MTKLLSEQAQSLIERMEFASTPMKELTGVRHESDLGMIHTSEQNKAFFDFSVSCQKVLKSLPSLVKRGRIKEDEVSAIEETHYSIIKDLNENYQWSITCYKQDSNGKQTKVQL